MSARRLCVGVLILLGVASRSGAGEPPSPSSSCSRQAARVAPCFTVRGRLSLYNGNPTARIWKVGTRRVLGVSDSRCVEPQCTQMPEALRQLLDWDHAIFAEFLVCPFTRSEPEHMQFVCIESAKDLVVRRRP